MADYKVILQTFRGSRLIAEESWSHPTTKARAEKMRREHKPTQPLDGTTCLLIVRKC